MRQEPTTAPSSTAPHHTFTMELDKDNANPTILNASDLPSRRNESTVKRRDDGGTGLFDDLIPRYTYLSDAFDDAVSASDSDDDAREDIDEQEIYGAPDMHATVQ
jgi:hypothetical protein